MDKKVPHQDSSRLSSLKDLEPISEKNIDAIEEEALSQVNRTISALEGAMASYENSPKKPPNMKEKYESYVRMNKALSNWARKLLLARKKVRTFAQKLQLIEELISTCMAFDELV